MRFALAGALILPALAGCNPQGHAPEGGIAVVRTWQELLSQPAVEIPAWTYPATPTRDPPGAGPIRLRIGIQDTRCEQYQGVLLYVLTENYCPAYGVSDFGMLTPPDGNSIRQWSSQAGPVRLVVTGPSNVPPKADGIASAKVIETRPARRLFVAPILADRPGPLDVHLYSRDGNRLASARIEVTAPRHPWARFAPPEEPARELTTAAPGEEGLFVATVQAMADGPWAPHWGSGAYPLFVELSDRWETPLPFPPPRTPLPQFITDVPSPSLRIAADGNTVTITSDRTILVSRPDHHFLVRWWVNGKPFVPRPVEEFEDMNGFVIFGKRIRLTVDFRPGRFGAKAGDEIRLQLLYCPRGCQPAGEGWAMKLAAYLDKDGPPVTVLSNVASFRVP